ncbi:MAG: hypothetical protein GX454_04105 [Brooklawnia sp.]|nr:hypothetical protein [Brooklawnia sp.]
MACPLDTDGTCFTQQMGALTVGTSELGTFGSMLIIGLGAMTLVVGIIQVLLMIVRSAMLVVLAGVLPISAAATNTETGKQMFQKTLGWLIGMILYKPAAAIIYATASPRGRLSHPPATIRPQGRDPRPDNDPCPPGERSRLMCPHAPIPNS